MERVTRVLLAERYTGGNGAAVLEMCQMITQFSGNVWSIQSDDGAMLVLRETNARRAADWPVLLGQWCVVAPDTGIVARVPDDLYQASYKSLADLIEAAVKRPALLNAIANSSQVKAVIASEVERIIGGGTLR
jgi:hypothetical protein